MKAILHQNFTTNEIMQTDLFWRICGAVCLIAFIPMPWLLIVPNCTFYHFFLKGLIQLDWDTIFRMLMQNDKHHVLKGKDDILHECEQLFIHYICTFPIKAF